jgi:hypothetical protein
MALNSGLVDIKKAVDGTFSSSRFVKLVKTIQPKLYKEAALVLNLVQMYLILERILMITCTMA